MEDLFIEIGRSDKILIPRWRPPRKTLSNPFSPGGGPRTLEVCSAKGGNFAFSDRGGISFQSDGGKDLATLSPIKNTRWKENLLFAEERKKYHEKKEENNTHTQARVIVDKPQRSLSMGRIRVIFPEKDEKYLPSSKSLYFPGFDFRSLSLHRFPQVAKIRIF